MTTHLRRGDVTLPAQNLNAKVPVFCLTERTLNSASYDVFIGSLARSVGELLPKMSQFPAVALEALESKLANGRLHIFHFK